MSVDVNNTFLIRRMARMVQEKDLASLDRILLLFFEPTYTSNATTDEDTMLDFMDVKIKVQRYIDRKV